MGGLGCGMFGVWDVGDVGCWGCGMLGMWDVRDVECWGCGMFTGMWDVDLQNALDSFDTDKKSTSEEPKFHLWVK